MQFLSDVERAALDAFPTSVDAGDLHHFIVTDADYAEIVNRRDGSGARLAAGLQLGAVRLLGFVPDDLGTAPGEVVEFVAGQVGGSVDDLASYSTRRHTISDHVTAAGQHLGFQRASRGDLKAVGDWLVDQALEHDQPLVLFRLACEHFRAQGLLRPGVTTVERLVATARDRAIDETWHRIADHLPKHRRDVLDRYLCRPRTKRAEQLRHDVQRSPAGNRPNEERSEETRRDLAADSGTTSRRQARVAVVSRAGQHVGFDRSTAEGRRAEMAYLDGLSDEELANWEPGHRYVTRNPAETPGQRTTMLERLADAEQRLAEFRSADD